MAGDELIQEMSLEAWPQLQTEGQARREAMGELFLAKRQPDFRLWVLVAILLAHGDEDGAADMRLALLHQEQEGWLYPVPSWPQGDSICRCFQLRGKKRLYLKTPTVRKSAMATRRPQSGHVMETAEGMLQDLEETAE